MAMKFLHVTAMAIFHPTKVTMAKDQKMASARIRRISPRRISLPADCIVVIPALLAVVFFSVTLAILHFQLERRHGIKNDATALTPGFVSQADSRSSSNITFSSTAKIEYPVADPIPNPKPADGYNTFSACMLIMDDNHLLIEWLAYHFHVLPLRYMIVAVDPRSRTSPTYLFNRWRRRGMVIEEWSDKDFWIERKPIEDNAPFQEKRDRHRGRQKFFYKQCLIRLKELNRTWVTMNDSDEYVLYNHAGGTQEKFDAWMERVRESIKQMKKTDLKLMQPSQIPPSTAKAGAMIHYIRHEQDAGISYYKSPCIGVPRLIFGAMESTAEERYDNVPTEWKDVADQLNTLRWRKHAGRNDFGKNALGKVLLDVSRIDVVNTPYFKSLHRPIRSICRQPWQYDWASGLRINHYLGSWESYSFRDDARRGGERSHEQWEYKATTNGEFSDDNIRPWLRGFVETMGQDGAKELLQDAGLPKNYEKEFDESWHLLPDKLEEIIKSKTRDAQLRRFHDWILKKKQIVGDPDQKKQDEGVDDPSTDWS